MRIARVVLVIVAVVCLGVALSYPLRYRQAQEKNDTDMEDLAQMRQQARQSQVENTRDDVVFPALPGRFAEDLGDEAVAPDEDGESEGEPEGGTEEATGGAGGDVGQSSGESAPAASEGNGGGSLESANSPEGPSDRTGNSGTGAREDSTEKAGDRSREDASEADDSIAARRAEDRQDGVEGMDADDGPIEGLEGTVVPVTEAGPTPEPTPTPKPTPTPEPTREPNYWDLGKYYAPTPEPTPTPKPVEGPTVAPTPTPDRSIRNGPLPYALRDKVVLDEAAILPELKDIYALNKDLVGWISIPDTVIDYPVVQAENGEFYLTHDFYGEENINGQIILDVLCDPYTPSYNLVVSGHHMKNGSMFGGLPQYRTKSYWAKHPFLEFDSLMERKIYVIFACFYSADYDEDETGFRYNAIIDYKIDADRWLAEIEDNQLYDTGIEREFGDEFITLTTCDRARHRNGRFVVVGRRIREGESFE